MNHYKFVLTFIIGQLFHLVLSAQEEVINIHYNGMVIYSEKVSKIDSVTFTRNISNVGDEPVSNFFATDTELTVGQSTTFVSNSLNSPTELRWNFGDGFTAIGNNLDHSYNFSGKYSVSLLATNEFGADVELKIDYITVSKSVECPNSVVDVEGNQYSTVQIGNQCWTAENMKVTKYPNGTDIRFVGNGTTWRNLSNTDRAWTYPEFKASNKDLYGLHYTRAGATNQSGKDVCPTGWHLPTNEEWLEMELLLGLDPLATGFTRGNHGPQMAGSKDLWQAGPLVDDPSFGASGFNALPAGSTSSQGSSGLIGRVAGWWSSGRASRSLFHERVGVTATAAASDGGQSVRCIKD